MIKCPDCKTPISDTAECCPRCGCKFRAEYERIHRLRQEIYELENDRSPRPAEPSSGMGGCAIVSIIMLIAAVAVVVYGFINIRTFGLLLIAGGGFAAYWCLGFVFAAVDNDAKGKASQKRAVAAYDNRPAQIAELKRQLAQLEAKFR